MEKPSNKNDLCGIISVIHRKTQIYLNQELKKYGLNSAEFVYLIRIKDTQATRLKTLGAHLRMDDAQTTRVIRSLEEKNLVSKIRSQEDKRAFDIELTPLGKELKPKIIEDRNEWIRLITLGMESTQVEAFIKNLSLVAQNAMELTEGK